MEGKEGRVRKRERKREGKIRLLSKLSESRLISLCLGEEASSLPLPMISSATQLLETHGVIFLQEKCPSHKQSLLKCMSHLHILQKKQINSFAL